MIEEMYLLVIWSYSLSCYMNIHFWKQDCPVKLHS